MGVSLLNSLLSAEWADELMLILIMSFEETALT